MPTKIKKLSPWKLLDQSVVYENKWFKVEKQHLLTTSGVELDYFVHHNLDSVICVCVRADQKVLIEHQYRPPVKKISIDYPAGRMESSDQSTEASIQRELSEETGFKINTLKKIGIIDKEPAFSSTRMHVYLATGDIDQEANPEETEEIVHSFVSPHEIIQLISTGQMSCTFCITATYLAFQELGWIKFSI